MFVQDFVHIERPLATTVDVFERAVIPRLAELVREAWDLPAAEAMGHHTSTAIHKLDIDDIDVRVTPRRPRADGFVFTISWPPSLHPWFPEFDADIEFAAVAPNQTYVQLSGQGRFPLLEPWSADDRRASRNCMVAIDRLLACVAATIESWAGRTNAEARPS